MLCFHCSEILGWGEGVKLITCRSRALPGMSQMDKADRAAVCTCLHQITISAEFPPKGIAVKRGGEERSRARENQRQSLGLLEQRFPQGTGEPVPHTPKVLTPQVSPGTHIWSGLCSL